jgi:hypothetical protein
MAASVQFDYNFENNFYINATVNRQAKCTNFLLPKVHFPKNAPNLWGRNKLPTHGRADGMGFVKS